MDIKSPRRCLCLTLHNGFCLTITSVMPSYIQSSIIYLPTGWFFIGNVANCWVNTQYRSSKHYFRIHDAFIFYLTCKSILTIVADKLDLKLMKWTPTTRRKPVLLDRKASTLNYMPYDHSVRPRVAPSTVPMFCFPHTALQVEGVVECCIACSKMDEINIVDIFSVGRRITKKTRENRLIIFVV